MFVVGPSSSNKRKRNDSILEEVNSLQEKSTVFNHNSRVKTLKDMSEDKKQNLRYVDSDLIMELKNLIVKTTAIKETLKIFHYISVGVYFLDLIAMKIVNYPWKTHKRQTLGTICVLAKSYVDGNIPERYESSPAFMTMFNKLKSLHPSDKPPVTPWNFVYRVNIIEEMAEKRFSAIMQLVFSDYRLRWTYFPSTMVLTALAMASPKQVLDIRKMATDWRVVYDLKSLQSCKDFISGMFLEKVGETPSTSTFNEEFNLNPQENASIIHVSLPTNQKMINMESYIKKLNEFDKLNSMPKKQKMDDVIDQISSIVI